MTLLKDDAVLVNVSRGKLIDEAALARELETRTAARRRSTCSSTSRSTPAARLWRSPHVLITPHVSGFFDGLLAGGDRDCSAENLRRFETGAPLVNLVDKQAGY